MARKNLVFWWSWLQIKEEAGGEKLFFRAKLVNFSTLPAFSESWVVRPPSEMSPDLLFCQAIPRLCRRWRWRGWKRQVSEAIGKSLKASKTSRGETGTIETLHFPAIAL